MDPAFRPHRDDASHVDADLPPLDDPYLTAPAAPQRARTSPLALGAVIALLFGPVGAIAAVVFGWAALRDIEQGRGRVRGENLARVGLGLGAILTCAWGGVLAIVVAGRATEVAVTVSTPPPPPVRPAETAAEREPASPPVPATPSPAPKTTPAAAAPKQTRAANEGAITVVDVGVAVTSLAEELAKQRAEASSAGQTVVLMTTASVCDPCRGVDASLRDPLLQTALARVRLVRVDIPAFHEELEALRVPHERFPGFFLLGPDLGPRDGIDGGEWDDDIARNIAPVLGAFVRGKYTTRREAWKPLPSSGVQL